GMKIAEIFGVTEGPLYEQMRRNILHVNGPDHTRLRSLVNPALSPRAVERYRPMMREFLEQLLAQVVAEGSVAPDTPDGSGAADDLISKLIAATVPDGNGQQGDRLSDVECINLVFNVLVGGVDTSQSQLAHTIRLLAEHPDQLELLAADPSLAEAAVEEGLRYEPITPFTARITTEDVSWRDVAFPEGTIVIVCAFTGNRDLGGGAAGDDGGGA